MLEAVPEGLVDGVLVCGVVLSTEVGDDLGNVVACLCYRVSKFTESSHDVLQSI